jgi:hypothetical protein
MIPVDADEIVMGVLDITADPKPRCRYARKVRAEVVYDSSRSRG